jgi:hypothetical protein
MIENPKVKPSEQKKEEVKKKKKKRSLGLNEKA